MRHDRDATHILPWRDVLSDTRFGPDSTSIAKMNVPGNPDLAGKDHSVAKCGGASDTDLGHQEAVPAHSDIVSELNQIVDLCPGTHARFA